jgi:hypothetical protein
MISQSDVNNKSHKAFDWKTKLKNIKKNNSIFQLYQKSKKNTGNKKTIKRSTVSNLKLSQGIFSKYENVSLSNSNIGYPKTSKAEKNVNIYSGIQNSLSQNKKNFTLVGDKGFFPMNKNKQSKSRFQQYELKRNKRMTNFTNTKYSKTFNKIPTSSVFYTNENFQY